MRAVIELRLAAADQLVMRPLLHDPAVLERVTAGLGLVPGDPVIDIGCGKAALLVDLAARYGIVGLGVDTNAAFLAEGRALAERRGVAHAVTFWGPVAPGQDLEAESSGIGCQLYFEALELKGLPRQPVPGQLPREIGQGPPLARDRAQVQLQRVGSGGAGNDSAGAGHTLDVQLAVGVVGRQIHPGASQAEGPDRQCGTEGSGIGGVGHQMNPEGIAAPLLAGKGDEHECARKAMPFGDGRRWLQSGIGDVLALKLLGLILLAFLSVLLLSNIITALTAFFLARDLELFAAAPVDELRFYGARLLEAVPTEEKRK